MVTTAVSALIASGAIAQITGTPSADPTTATEPAIAPKFSSISEMTVGNIIGKNVYDPNGDTIGDIDYIIDRDGGANVVVGVGGFLGLGEYTVTLPLEDLTFDAEQQMIKLDTTKEALKERPEIDETELESLPDDTQLGEFLASADTTEDAGTASEPATRDETSTDTPASDDATADTATKDADATVTDDTNSIEETKDKLSD
ncbi:PRC-barrel domain protein [Pseudosulfitobacter pseudonitzschiae]|uniref:PRC-barrel domain protein n=2 Tax=Rhodobacterales TaxID=204455 RepID=A0A221K0I8_9RHOB|nr:PRC-barrel domain protein [Pseudosulfitobacter pseudonitzschiae]